MRRCSSGCWWQHRVERAMITDASWADSHHCVATVVVGKNNARTAQFLIAAAGENLDSKVRVPLKQVLGRRVNVANTIYDSETGQYSILSTKFLHGQRQHFLEIYDLSFI